MRIRPYQNKDFNTISPWITEERSHALWCANLIPYPLEKKGFDDLLQEAEERFGDSPFVATTDVGRILRTFKIKKNVEVTDNGKIII